MPQIEFDEFRIDLDLHQLSQNDQIVEIGPKPLDVLLFLIENRHRIVSPDMLREAIWGGSQLSAATIPTAIMAVRRSLEDPASSPRYIKSVRSRGYHFIAEVRRSSSAVPPRSGIDDGEVLPFVGRSDTIANLNRLLRDVRQSGHGRLTLISADAGLGKSRLVDEFIQQIPKKVPAYSTRAPSVEGAPPFWPWSQLIRSAVANPEASSRIQPHARALSDAIPELAIEIESDRDCREETTEFNIFRRWTDGVLALAENGAAVVTVDDIHNLDRDSLLLLYWLADEISSRPLLLIATTRPFVQSNEAAGIVSDIEAIASVSRIPLQPLSADQIRSFLNPLVHNIESLAQNLFARTGGNAFYITHLLRCAEAIPDLDLDDADIGGLPLHAREIVARQLSDLPSQSRSVLAAASVLGNRFDIEALAHATALTIDQTAEAVQPALSAWILRESIDGYSFNHQLLRESLYRTLSASSRKALHLKIAEHAAQKRPNSTNSSELAHHRIASLPLGDPNQACSAALTAARDATRRRAHSEAKRLLTQALAVFDSFPTANGHVRHDILIELASEALHCGQREDARSILQDAANEARKASDWESLARCALSLSPDFLTIEVGAWDPALVNLIEEALARIGKSDRSLRAMLLARLSIANQWNPTDSKRRAMAAEAKAISVELDSDEVRLASLAAQAEILNGPRYASDRLKLVRELGDTAQRLGNVPQVLLHHTRATTALLELGDIEGVEAENSKHAALSAQTALPQYRWLSMATESMLSALHGDLSSADAISMDYLELTRNHVDANILLAFGGQHLLRKVESDAGDLSFDQIDKIVEDHASVRFWRALAGWARYVSGDRDVCASVLASFTEYDVARIAKEPGGGVGMAALAEIAAAVGTPEQQERMLLLISGLENHCVCAGYGIAYAGSFSRYAALLERSLGNFDRAIHLLGKSLAGELRRRAPSWAMYSLADLITTKRAAGYDTSSAIEQARTLLIEHKALSIHRAKRLLAEACT